MGSHEVFLNLHKFCGERHPVTFRNAVLLNEGKLLLSERAHCQDELEYDGMISFHDVGSLPSAYEAILASDWRTTQAAARRRFASRFAPPALFRRAAIYRDWNLTASALGAASTTDRAADAAEVGVGATYDPRSSYPHGARNLNARTGSNRCGTRTRHDP